MLWGIRRSRDEDRQTHSQVVGPGPLTPGRLRGTVPGGQEHHPQVILGNCMKEAPVAQPGGNRPGPGLWSWRQAEADCMGVRSQSAQLRHGLCSAPSWTWRWPERSVLPAWMRKTKLKKVKGTSSPFTARNHGGEWEGGVRSGFNTVSLVRRQSQDLEVGRTAGGDILTSGLPCLIPACTHAHVKASASDLYPSIPDAQSRDDEVFCPQNCPLENVKSAQLTWLSG